MKIEISELQYQLLSKFFIEHFTEIENNNQLKPLEKFAETLISYSGINEDIE